MTSVLPSLRLVRSRSFFIVAAVVVLLLVAAGGVYAYDSGRDGTIAKGISIGGGGVGGLKAPVAKERLRAPGPRPPTPPGVPPHPGPHFPPTPPRAPGGGGTHRPGARAPRPPR